MACGFLQQRATPHRLALTLAPGCTLSRQTFRSAPGSGPLLPRRAGALTGSVTQVVCRVVSLVDLLCQERDVAEVVGAPLWGHLVTPRQPLAPSRALLPLGSSDCTTGRYPVKTKASAPSAPLGSCLTSLRCRRSLDESPPTGGQAGPNRAELAAPSRRPHWSPWEQSYSQPPLSRSPASGQHERVAP